MFESTSDIPYGTYGQFLLMVEYTVHRKVANFKVAARTEGNGR